MNKVGRLTTSFDSRSAWGVCLKNWAIAGIEGAMIAAAIIVSMLRKSKVSFDKLILTIGDRIHCTLIFGDKIHYAPSVSIKLNFSLQMFYGCR